MPEEMGKASECFITGTAAEVTPVSEIGPCKFTPGEVCRALIADFTAAAQPRKATADQPRQPRLTIGQGPKGALFPLSGRWLDKVSNTDLFRQKVAFQWSQKTTSE